jgi:hypothetical protein
MFMVVSSVLSRQISPLYLLALLGVEGLVGIIVGEFIRGPWEGQVREEEIIMEEMNERLFESISSMHTTNDYAFGTAINTANLNSQGAESNAPSQYRQLRN